MHFYKPMLAFSGKRKDLKRKDMIFEIKFDGTRAICYKEGKRIKLINRRGSRIEYRYPELKNIWKNIRYKKCVLDGEIVVFDSRGLPSFRLLQQREHAENEIKINLLAKMFPACFIVFDILEADEKVLTDFPLVRRKEILSKSIEESNEIKISYYTNDGESLWKIVKKKGLEGVMAKLKNSPYEEGRSRYWLKIKTFSSIDCVVGGYTSGKGKREGTIGALLIGVYTGEKLHYMGRVGTGFNENDLKLITQLLKKLKTDKCPFADFNEPPKIKRISTFVKPEIVVEVKYLEITSELKLRAPVFMRIRDDKAAIECNLPTFL